jgi:hypothetical protein
MTEIKDLIDSCFRLPPNPANPSRPVQKYRMTAFMATFATLSTAEVQEWLPNWLTGCQAKQPRPWHSPHKGKAVVAVRSHTIRVDPTRRLD